MASRRPGLCTSSSTFTTCSKRCTDNQPYQLLCTVLRATPTPCQKSPCLANVFWGLAHPLVCCLISCTKAGLLGTTVCHQRANPARAATPLTSYSVLKLFKIVNILCEKPHCGWVRVPLMKATTCKTTKGDC